MFCAAKKEAAGRGFAVLDLLALLATTAVLVTLFSAWLSILRQRTEAVRCLSNVRQMMRAFTLYADHHVGRLPPNEDSSFAPIGHQWFLGDARDPSIVTNIASAGDERINLLAPYTDGEYEIWKCPGDKFSFRLNGKKVTTARSVSMNCAVGTYCVSYPNGHFGAPMLRTHGAWLDGNHSHTRDRTFRTFGRLSEFLNPAETFVFIDELPASFNDGLFGQAGYDPKNPASSIARWIDYPANFHGSAAGVGFADMSAVIHQWKGLRYPIGQTGLPTTAVTPAQRPDWEWLALRTTQPIR